MEYKRAVQIASLVLDLASKAKRAVHDLLEPPEVRFAECTRRQPVVIFLNSHPYFYTLNQNDVESMRLKTRDYELIVGQSGNFTLVVIQQQGQQVPAVAAQPAGSTTSKKSEVQKPQTPVTAK